MRLIDADALYKFIQDQMEKETGAYTRGKNKAFNIVKSALHNECATPTIDAVSVVWCGECEKWQKEEESWLCKNFGYCTECMMDCPADHFCSYGERKDGEG